jgi:hypothetical protein
VSGIANQPLRHRGSTGIATTGCLPRITSSGPPSRRSANRARTGRSSRTSANRSNRRRSRLPAGRQAATATDRLTEEPNNRDTPTTSGEIDTTKRHHFRPPRAAVFNRRQQSQHQTSFGDSARRRWHPLTLEPNRRFFRFFTGTFRPSRCQRRNTRDRPTCHPSSRRSHPIRRYPYRGRALVICSIRFTSGASSERGFDSNR